MTATQLITEMKATAVVEALYFEGFSNTNKIEAALAITDKMNQHNFKEGEFDTVRKLAMRKLGYDA